MPSKTIPLTSIPLTSILVTLAAILAGICVPASAQTYISFDAFSSGLTFPYEMDSSGRIVGRSSGGDFVRNTDGSISVLGGRRLFLRLSALECLNILADCMTYFALC